MSDIVDELRATEWSLAHDAADEIARLRAELAGRDAKIEHDRLLLKAGAELLKKREDECRRYQKILDDYPQLKRNLESAGRIGAGLAKRLEEAEAELADRDARLRAVVERMVCSTPDGIFQGDARDIIREAGFERCKTCGGQRVQECDPGDLPGERIDCPDCGRLGYREKARDDS